jgi:hypothetical protein
MSVLSFQQIEQMAQQLGFTGNSAQTIAAIALAESGGDTQAVGHNLNGTSDYGLVQINSIHFATGDITAGGALNPYSALAYAYTLSKKGSDFTPWSTFTNGRYTQFLSSNQTSTPQSTGMSDTNSSVMSGVSSFVNGVGSIFLLAFVSIIIIVIGFYFLAS